MIGKRPDRQRKPAVSPRSAAAYHEAGHAVMCRAVGLRVRSVSIDTNNWYIGQTTHRHRPCPTGRGSSGPHKRLELEKEVLVCLAGALAQQLYAGAGKDAGDAVDAVTATRLAEAYFHSARTAAAYVAFAREWATQMLESPVVWAAIERLARALLREGALDGHRAEEIIGGGATRTLLSHRNDDARYPRKTRRPNTGVHG